MFKQNRDENLKAHNERLENLAARIHEATMNGRYVDIDEVENEFDSIVNPVAVPNEQRITVTDTPHSVGRASILEFNEDSCQLCKAPWGHYGVCPTLNRNVAEALSAAHGTLSVEDVIRTAGLGIVW